VPKHIIGRIGQEIAETITCGRPKSFLLITPNFHKHFRADVYIERTDSALEVKTGRSKIESYQISDYQSACFTDGFSVMFVQNPHTGEIGPDLGDFITLRARGVAFTQVWFTSAKYGGPRKKKRAIASTRAAV